MRALVLATSGVVVFGGLMFINRMYGVLCCGAGEIANAVLFLCIVFCSAVISVKIIFGGSGPKDRARESL